jgi:hypothetical protein
MIIVAIIISATLGVIIGYAIGTVDPISTKEHCTATLKSGEQCDKVKGHTDHHHAIIDPGPYQQEYCWNDSTCGLYGVGFFYIK